MLLKSLLKKRWADFAWYKICVLQSTITVVVYYGCHRFVCLVIINNTCFRLVYYFITTVHVIAYLKFAPYFSVKILSVSSLQTINYFFAIIFITFLVTVTLNYNCMLCIYILCTPQKFYYAAALKYIDFCVNILNI